MLIAVALRPNYALAQHNLGSALLELGELEQAISHYLTAIDIQPNAPETHYELGIAYRRMEKYAEALSSYDQTLELDSTYVDALNEKALLFLTARDARFRNLAEAIRCAELAVELSLRQYGKSLDVLAQTYAAAGRYPEAVEAATQAVNSLLARINKAFATASAERLATYREKAAANTVKTKPTHSASS